MTRLLYAMAVATLIALTGLAALPARAQDANCGPLVDVLAGLAVNYAETSRVDALMANGDLLILTASESGTWTGLAVTPDLMACIVAYGQGFEVNEPAPVGTKM